MTITESEITEAAKQLGEMLVRKNRDYGSAVASSPCLTPSLDPLTTILVRMSDKVSRLISLTKSTASVSEESAQDTIVDLAGYCLLYVIVNAKQKLSENSGEELIQAE